MENVNVYGKIGEQTNLLGGGAAFRIDRQCGLISTNLHGKYTEQVLRGNVFGVCNQAAVATTAALATTWTGLGIVNPANSQFNLSILQFSFAQTVAGSADGAIGLMVADTTGLASTVAIYNRLLGGRGSIALADDGATIGTPVLVGIYGSIGTLAVTGYGVENTPPVQIDGSIIVPPGRSLLTYTTKATTAALIFGIVFEEIPI